MAKRMCNLNLDEKVIEAMDDLAEKTGMSRSQVTNQILGATIGEASTADVVRMMFASALETTKTKRASGAKRAAKIGA